MTRKSWNSTFYQTEALERFLNRLLCRFGDDSAALVLPEGKPLHVRALHPADSATLPVAIAQCHQYLQLRDGDIAIVNDPYSGGTRLSDITLAAGVSFETAGRDADLLIGVRLPFPPRMSLTGKLDEEGLRIPPMPLAVDGKLNKDILMHMAGAPQAPPQLQQTIEAAVQRIELVRAALKCSGRDPYCDLRKANYKRYLQDCKTSLKAMISRLPLGETLLTANLESGEMLKLRLEIVDDKVIFDFSGTESSSRVQLTELATFGACFHTLSTVLAKPIPANSGTFQLLEVHTPTSGWVNAKAPAATSRGVSDGLAMICATAFKAFGRMSQPHRAGVGGHGSCRVQVQYKDGRVFTDATHGGMGAQKEQPGLAGWNLWLNGEIDGGSIEASEKNYPILIRSVTTRPNSAGKGKSAGGEGIIKTYTATEPAHATWTLEQTTHKPEGMDGGKSGATAEILLQRSGNSEKEKLAACGSMDLNVGDVLRLHTAGGGGFGEPEASPAIS